MKVFISQPMKDKTDEEIKRERENAIKIIKDNHPNTDIEIIDSFFEDCPPDAKPLWFIGKSFEKLSEADLAVFIGLFEPYRGCRMEYFACKYYDIPVATIKEDNKFRYLGIINELG